MRSSARGRARKCNIEFDLVAEDIVIPTHCPVLGIELKSGIGTGRGPNDDSPTIDRIDSSLGYVRGNVMVMSAKANSMKHSANPDELLKFAEWIFSTYKR
jgi:hypothetical protein